MLPPLPCSRSTSLLFNSLVRFCSQALTVVNQVPSESAQQGRKILKVAILGRPNAGKSTLINRILELNVCDVSSKAHTTRLTIKTAFVSGNTQIVLLDTPGAVTKREFSKFNLSKEFAIQNNETLQEVDLIGVIHEVNDFVTLPFCLGDNFLRLLQTFNDKPKFLVLNKIDKFSYGKLLKFTNQLQQKKTIIRNDSQNKISFSKVFMVSAMKNRGVGEVVDYLLGEAKEGDWILEDNQVCDTPLDVLIINLLRAKIMDLVPHEIPYQCRYEVEYLEENSLGEYVCVALITCKLLRHQKMIVNKRKGGLKELCQSIESDLYNIFKKTLRLRVVVTTTKTLKSY